MRKTALIVTAIIFAFTIVVDVTSSGKNGMCSFGIGCSVNPTPTIPDVPVAETPELMMDNDAGVYSIVKRGDAIGLVGWKVSLKNEFGTDSLKLVVDFYDENYQILAEDDRSVAVKPGDTLALDGLTDVPTAQLDRLAHVRAHLVATVPEK